VWRCMGAFCYAAEQSCTLCMRRAAEDVVQSCLVAVTWTCGCAVVIIWRGGLPQMGSTEQWFSQSLLLDVRKWILLAAILVISRMQLTGTLRP
jgi:hypothetical protein